VDAELRAKDRLPQRIDVACEPKDGTEEIRQLQDCINDLISLQTLPAVWDGRESGSIVSTLLDVQVRMLRLDFAYVRLSDSINGSPVEFLQLAQHRAPPPQALEIGRALDRWLTNESVNAPLVVPNPAGDGEINIAPFRLGLTDEIGVLVAGSKRADFPTPTETLLLRMAANQALVALQEARQLHEQRRAAVELERRVADRTAQLTAANEALRESEKKYRTLFDSIDEGFCTIEVLFDEKDYPVDYRFLEVNPSFEKQTGIQNARGRRMREIAPQHEEHWFEIYGRIALTGEPERFENQAAQLHRWYDTYAFRVGESGDRKVAILFKDISEQRQSQEAMRVAKARFEGILAIAEDAIISVDSNQNIVLFNQGAEKVFGHAENEVIGKPLSILLPQRFVHTHRGHIEEFAKSLDISRSMAQRREVFGRRKDGSEFPAEASISKLALGNEVVFTVMLRDITQRKKAEGALRRSESYLSEAQRLSHTGSFGWRVSTGEISWSAETFQIFQFDRAIKPSVELVLQRVHPEERDFVKQAIEHASQDGKNFDFEHRLLMPDGSIKHVRVVAHAEREASGKLEFIGAVMDVTVAKETEDKIRLIINTVPGLLWTARPDGWVDFLNQRWLDYTGMTLEQGLGWAWQPGYHPDDLGNVLNKWRAAVTEKKPLDVEARLRRFDGEYRWFMKRAFPLFDNAGRVLGWYGGNIDIHDLKQAEEKLRRTETYLTEGQRLSRTGSWAWSVKTKENLFWSKEQYRIFGFDPDTESGQYVAARERIHAADLRAFDESLEQAIKKQKDFVIDFRIVLPSGEVKYVHNLGHPVLNAAGELIEYIGTTVDVTEQVKAKAALEEAFSKIKKSEASLRLIIDTIPALAWSIEPDGSVEFVNRRWSNYTGLTIEQARGSGWMSVVHQEDIGWMSEQRRMAMASGKPFELESRMRRHDGQYRWFINRADPLLDEKGKIVKWYGTNTDIDDRKRAEEALRRSENYLAEAQRLTHSGSWVFNILTGALVHSSEEHRRLFGFDPGKGIPSFDELVSRIHPEDRTFALREFDATIPSGKDFDAHFRIVLPDGAIRYVYGTGHPVFNQSGDVHEFIGMVMDVTERRRAEEALRQAQADLAHVSRLTTMGELTASIAHEVNQPLTAVVNNANASISLLPKDTPDLEEVREALADIIDDANRASDVIARIRQLAKRAPVEKSLLDMRDVVQDVLALARFELAARKVTINTDLSQDLPSISGDRVQLQQVLLNLVINGMDAMNQVEESKRVLTVCGRREKNDGTFEARLSVSDSGVGFKPEEMDRLFEAFYTTKPQGMGMGLAISHSIIEAHGGRLWAELNQGPGATFLFSLPIAGNAAS
jgi:PAS domain S-box-containing protein